jgi:hypothetical protein
MSSKFTLVSFLLMFLFSICDNSNIRIDLGAYSCVYKNGRVELITNDLPSSILATPSSVSYSVKTTSSAASFFAKTTPSSASYFARTTPSSSSIVTTPFSSSVVTTPSSSSVVTTPSSFLHADSVETKYNPENTFIVDVGSSNNLPFVGYLEDDDEGFSLFFTNYLIS